MSLVYKTLIVDGHSQCSLTVKLLGFDEKKENDDFRAKLNPIIDGEQYSIKPVETVDVKDDKLLLLVGNIELVKSNILAGFLKLCAWLSMPIDQTSCC